MSLSNASIVLLTFLVAVMLLMVPLPYALSWWRPSWVLLMVIFWSLTAPSHIGLMFAWCLGLYVDGFTGTVLGVHAFGFMLSSYIVRVVYAKMRLASIMQQSLFVFTILFIHQSWLALIQGMLGQMTEYSQLWITAVTSALVWPWMMLLLGDLKYRFTSLR